MQLMTVNTGENTVAIVITTMKHKYVNGSRHNRIQALICHSLGGTEDIHQWLQSDRFIQGRDSKHESPSTSRIN
jgi:hypothetical protein